MTADLTKPLRDVPVGDYVVHDGKVVRHTMHCNTHATDGGLCPRATLDTTVLHLDGGQPVPLREVEGADHDFHVWNVQASEVWMWDHVSDEWHSPTTLWSNTVQATDLCWPLARPEPEATSGPARWEGAERASVPPPRLAEDHDPVRRCHIDQATAVAEELVHNLRLNPRIWDPVEALDVAIEALRTERNRLAHNEPSEDDR